MNTMLHRGALAIAGLIAVAGMSAGPGLAAQTTPAAATTPITATTPTTSDQPVPVDKLLPHGIPDGQSTIPLSDEQVNNAKAIIEATKKAGMDERAAVIAIATSLQESKLENLGHLGARNDHDSQGLFQQRPSSGWGTVEQITDPQYATTAFLKALAQVDGWRDMPLTKAAQKVQVSAYPDHYAQWEKQAADLVAQYWNS